VSFTKFLWLKSILYFSFHDHGGFSGVIDTTETVSGVTPLKKQKTEVENLVTLSL
jgi:hypothetical protein